MSSICDEVGHKFVPIGGKSGLYYEKRHRCSVCGLEEACTEFDVSYEDKSEWQWRCDLPDICVEQYEVIYTCEKCGGSYSLYVGSKDELPRGLI